ncbi:MAG TPA: YlxR family protein [Armatimonadetes bacterium]|nr:YlxR family protein [Armatimonadota bacterium]
MGKKRRHVPQRTCVACRAVRPKRELLRVVRTPEGHLEVDPTGKKPGRGAYVGMARECIERARKQRSFQKALGVECTPELWVALEAALPNTAVTCPLSQEGEDIARGGETVTHRGK